MSKATMQGRLNAKKEMFIKILKEKGVFIELCEDNGYMYKIHGKVFNVMHTFIVGIKNGNIVLKEMIKQ